MLIAYGSLRNLTRQCLFTQHIIHLGEACYYTSHSQSRFYAPRGRSLTLPENMDTLSETLSFQNSSIHRQELGTKEEQTKRSTLAVWIQSACMLLAMQHMCTEHVVLQPWHLIYTTDSWSCYTVTLAFKATWAHLHSDTGVT